MLFKDDDILVLTELGRLITPKLLLTIRCPHIFTICMQLKEGSDRASVGYIYDYLYDDNAGNRGFINYTLEKAIRYGLIEIK